MEMHVRKSFKSSHNLTLIFYRDGDCNRDFNRIAHSATILYFVNMISFICINFIMEQIVFLWFHHRVDSASMVAPQSRQCIYGCTIEQIVHLWLHHGVDSESMVAPYGRQCIHGCTIDQIVHLWLHHGVDSASMDGCTTQQIMHLWLYHRVASVPLVAKMS